jgi:branched-chain amino acid transport system substrate-binding protein
MEGPEAGATIARVTRHGKAQVTLAGEMRRVLLLLALVPVAAAHAGSTASPGVMPSSILIGGIAPLAGEGSAVAKGAAAYFRYVNARGGVNRRTIEYRVLDDGGDPVRALEAARRLVQQDGVFALFNTVGTGANLAIRGFLNQSRVPQLFVGSGATTWGRDAARYPWTIGYVPSYQTEGMVLAHQVLKTQPNAKIAVLYQDDEDGRDLLAGFRRGLGPKAGQMAAVGYDPAGPDVKAQVAELRATKADAFVNFGFRRFASQAIVEAKRLGWRPQVYVTASARAVAAGAVSVVYLKDPGDPRWAGDPGIALFERVLTKYARVGDLKNRDYVAGMASAFTLVDALKKAGKNPTRAGIMATARRLSEANNPFVLPGIVLKTGPADAFPIQQVALQRWSRGHWSVFAGPLTIAG